MLSIEDSAVEDHNGNGDEPIKQSKIRGQYVDNGGEVCIKVSDAKYLENDFSVIMDNVSGLEDGLMNRAVEKKKESEFTKVGKIVDESDEEWRLEEESDKHIAPSVESSTETLVAYVHPSSSENDRTE